MNTTSIKGTKSADPIWRHIWLDRIGKSLWLLYALVYVGCFLFFRLWETQGFYFLLLGCFNLLVGAGIVFNEVRQERYWRRIDERRSLALQDPVSFRARNQPLVAETSLQLPVTIRLRFNMKFIAIVSGSILVFMLLCVMIGFLLATGNSFHWQFILLALGIMLAVFLVFFVLVYFFRLRSQTQSIELTEEGVTTSYLGHKESLLWDDARLFAHYSQGIVNKPVIGSAFELSNAQTVVRWSQQRVILPYLKVQSNQNQKDDFSWLVGQVNAYIIKRTGLPLLDLNDQQVLSSKQSKQLDQTGRQHDPLTSHLKLTGQQIWSFAIILIFALGIIVLSLSGHLFPETSHVPSGSSDALGGFLLLGGILMLLSVVSFPILYLVTRRYFAQIQKRRALSKIDPERFRVQLQPTPVVTPPQPGKISVEVRRSYLFMFAFSLMAVVTFVLLEIIFRQTGLYLLIILLVVLGLSLFSAFFGVAVAGKRNRRLMEVGPNGITSRLGLLESQINWPDVQRFTRYRGLSLTPGRSRVYIYELTGENTVVRWHWLHKLRSVTLEPPLTPEEYEQWMTGLSGYIVERTGLPLLDLDQAASGQAEPDVQEVQK